MFNDLMAGLSIAKCDGHITQKADIASTPNWTALGILQKVSFLPLPKRQQTAVIKVVPRREVIDVGQLRVAIPRTNQLTIVTAKDTVANGAAVLGINATFMLDGQIRNTGCGIELVRGDNCLSGTNINTSTATAAVCFDRLIIGQLQTHKQLTQHKKRACLLVEQ